MTLQVSSVGRARAFFENLENPILAVLGLFRPEMVVSKDGWLMVRMVRMVPCCARCKTASPPAIHTIDHHTFRLGILVRNDIARMLHGRR